MLQSLSREQKRKNGAKRKEGDKMEEILVDIQKIVKGLQTNVSELQTDVRGLQTGVNELQIDVKGLQQGQKKMEGDIQRIEKKVDKNYKLLKDLDDTMVGIKEIQDEKINKLYSKAN